MDCNLKYKHILFDLDGTIFDTHYANMQALYEVIHEWYPDTKETMDSLDRIFGIPGSSALEVLGIEEDKRKDFFDAWVLRIKQYAHTVKVFAGMLPVIKSLYDSGATLGIVTSRTRSYGGEGNLDSFMPDVIAPYFKYAVCADDVPRPKPAPDSLLHYMKLTEAKPSEILFVGDAATDLQCANDAGVDFGLALWGYVLKDHLRCAHYFKNPYEILCTVKKISDNESKWFQIAHEINAIGQIGLAYSQDKFDIERFTRLQEIACEICHNYTQESYERVKEALCFDKGYQTPKIDTRGVVFNDKGEILLVKESSGLWGLPGGWCDDDKTICENVKKELLEEAGLTVYVSGLIAILDHRTYNRPKMPYGVLKAFLMCQCVSGQFVQNTETIDAAYFAKDNLPLDKLRVGTTTYEQLLMCFDAYNNDNWKVVVE